jgi:hypothetical protein
VTDFALLEQKAGAGRTHGYHIRLVHSYRSTVRFVLSRVYYTTFYDSVILFSVFISARAPSRIAQFACLKDENLCISDMFF